MPIDNEIGTLLIINIMFEILIALRKINQLLSDSSQNDKGMLVV
jgi:hypothetical protein